MPAVEGVAAGAATAVAMVAVDAQAAVAATARALAIARVTVPAVVATSRATAMVVWAAAISNRATYRRVSPIRCVVVATCSRAIRPLANPILCVPVWT